MIKAPGTDASAAPPALIVVQHWDEELKRPSPSANGAVDWQSPRPVRNPSPPSALGGMGGVYSRARQQARSRESRMKVLPEAFTRTLIALARFKREAQALAPLNHPTSGRSAASGTAGATHALVLELVEGPIGRRLSRVWNTQRQRPRVYARGRGYEASARRGSPEPGAPAGPWPGRRGPARFRNKTTPSGSPDRSPRPSEAAHGAGGSSIAISKPANMQGQRGGVTVKVLDFGAGESWIEFRGQVREFRVQAARPPIKSPTITSPAMMTGVGAISWGPRPT